MKHILKCSNCGSYTLREICPKCNQHSIICFPPKYSPEDKYADYRRKAKEEERIKKGFI